MTKVLEIAIRNVEGTYKMQVREQYSRNNVSFRSRNGYTLESRSCPQVRETFFFIRGDHKHKDSQWSAFDNANNIAEHLRLLREYADGGGWGIQSLVTSNELTIVISTDIMREDFNIDDIIQKMRMMNITSESEIKEKLTCNVCGVEEKTIVTLDVGEGYVNVCKKCKADFPTCEGCKNFREKLTPHTNSLGATTKICKWCNSTMNCQKCEFKELRKDVKNFVQLTENGDVHTVSACLKCNEGTTRCKSCSNHYNSDSKYCPCKIPKDFKQLILPYNADVLEYLPMDADCEIGMELEVGVRCKNRVHYLDIFEHTKNIIDKDAIMVYDSSIDYKDREQGIMNDWRGFEIVTRPMNLRNMVKFINNLSQNRHKLLCSWDVETTGIHIHISRRLLKRIELGKLLVFINNPKNARLIKFIARRDNQRFARLGEKRILDYKDTRRECHYEALNTNKPHTIEFRIFRGSLDQKTLMSYIQFVRSAVAFVKQTPADKLLEDVYLEFLHKSDKSSYRDLKDHLGKLSKKGELQYIGGDE